MQVDALKGHPLVLDVLEDFLLKTSPFRAGRRSAESFFFSSWRFL